jgi:hypothetical protein
MLTAQLLDTTKIAVYDLNPYLTLFAIMEIDEEVAERLPASAGCIMASTLRNFNDHILHQGVFLSVKMESPLAFDDEKILRPSQVGVLGYPATSFELANPDLQFLGFAFKRL